MQYSFPKPARGVGVWKIFKKHPIMGEEASFRVKKRVISIMSDCIDIVWLSPSNKSQGASWLPVWPMIRILCTYATLTRELPRMAPVTNITLISLMLAATILHEYKGGSQKRNYMETRSLEHLDVWIQIYLGIREDILWRKKAFFRALPKLPKTLSMESQKDQYEIKKKTGRIPKN